MPVIRGGPDAPISRMTGEEVIELMRRIDEEEDLDRSRADRPDKGDRGNAAFADGHVDYITRGQTWAREHAMPWEMPPGVLPRP